MKKLIIINGTMGVGKSSVAQLLNKSIPNSALVDGDWCCKINSPLSDSIKNLYLKNINTLINNYLSSDDVTDVILCWVIHKNEILQKILQNTDLRNVNVYVITLQANEQTLTKRIIGRFEYEKRDKGELERSLFYQQNYYNDISSYKLDTSDMSIERVAEKIIQIISDEKYGFLLT